MSSNFSRLSLKIGLLLIGLIVLDLLSISGIAQETNAGLTANVQTIESGTYDLNGQAYAADIGTLLAPETRSKADSRLIELPLIRIHATGDEPAEPIFLLAGGPGGSNVRWTDPTLARLLEHHDLVMVGYRGIDGSVSLDAPEVTEVYKTFKENPLSSENLQRLGQAYSAAFQRLQAEGIDMDSYTMIDVIDDLEAAREQLGYNQINLYGRSYGTRVAYLYGLRYPESLHRSAMLAVNTPGRFVWEPERIDAQLHYYAELWQKDAEAVARSPDILATMQNVLATLPQEWEGFRIDPDKVRTITHFQLFQRSSAAQVFDAYVAAENGDYSGLAYLSVAYDQIIPTSANWGDRASKALSADYDPNRDYEADMDPAGSILGSPLSKELGVLKDVVWPIQPIPEEYRTLRISEVETLLVNGSIDFSTPVENARELLPFLPNGELVVLAEMGHVTDLVTRQPEALLHLLEAFYLSGEVDDSQFKYEPMNFTPDKTFQEIAKEFVAQAAIPQESLEKRLQAALEATVANPDTVFPGALLFVNSPELDNWSGAAGVRNIDTATPLKPDDLFRAGSIIKPFVSTVVLQLVEEGLLSLDDPMPMVLPESITTRFANSDYITVRMLLNHTSGIPEWLTEAAIEEIAANPARVRNVDEYFDLATSQEPYFAPGESWTYSNTDYNLLGLVIEQVTSRSWREEVRERIIEPLQLENTQLPEPGNIFIPDNHAHGYNFLPSDGTALDLTGIDPSMAGAAGGHALVTTTTDLVRFLEALLAGELFQQAETLEEMLAFVEVTYPDWNGYGLGLMNMTFPGGIEAIGHLGGTGGFSSFVGYFPAYDMTIATVITTQGSVGQVLAPIFEVLAPDVQTSTPNNAYENPEVKAFTPAITDAGGNVIAGSIASLEKITLGGVDQWVLIRGADITKPVLLVLHGGPGFAMTPWLELFQKAKLEEDFVVVHWDQRGAGKSYSKTLSAEDMHVENFINDTLELTDILRNRFEQDKIFMTGHSWGSALGFLTIMENPEPYHAYIASGEAAHWNKRQIMSYEWVLAQARNTGDDKVIEALESLEPFDPTSLEHITAKNQFLDRYRGGDYYTEGLWDKYLEYVLSGQSSAYTDTEVQAYTLGLEFASQTVSLEIAQQDYDLFRDFPKSSIPIHFFAGRHDHVTPSELTEAYYVFLEAPAKSFTWFEDSAHTMMFDQPDKWAEELIRIAQETLKQ